MDHWGMLSDGIMLQLLLVCMLPPDTAPNGSLLSELMIVEADLLGEGAFSRVSEVTEETTKRTFALKRMTKTAALQCPEHVYCEQHISKNTANAFCIRQYASFKVQGL